MRSRVLLAAGALLAASCGAGNPDTFNPSASRAAVGRIDCSGNITGADSDATVAVQAEEGGTGRIEYLRHWPGDVPDDAIHFRVAGSYMLFAVEQRGGPVLEGQIARSNIANGTATLPAEAAEILPGTLDVSPAISDGEAVFVVRAEC